MGSTADSASVHPTVAMPGFRYAVVKRYWHTGQPHATHRRRRPSHAERALRMPHTSPKPCPLRVPISISTQRVWPLPVPVLWGAYAPPLPSTPEALASSLVTQYRVPKSTNTPACRGLASGDVVPDAVTYHQRVHPSAGLHAQSRHHPIIKRGPRAGSHRHARYRFHEVARVLVVRLSVTAVLTQHS